MGDPKFSRKMYDTPSHPWKTARIQEENALIRKYGLKNKREVWKAKSQLARFRGQARKLVARMRTGDLQAEKEKDLLIKRLHRMGFLGENALLDDILSLDIDNIFSRRFQTIIYLKGMARSPKQARQFIVHGHASIDGRKVTVPGYLVKRTEEKTIEFRVRSPLTDETHPERPGSDKARAERSDGSESPVKGKVRLETGEEDDGGKGEGGKSSGKGEATSDDKKEKKEEGGKGEKKPDDKGEDKKEEGDKGKEGKKE
jgi:small subunit ribosomal protein S4